MSQATIELTSEEVNKRAKFLFDVSFLCPVSGLNAKSRTFREGLFAKVADAMNRAGQVKRWGHMSDKEVSQVLDALKELHILNVPFSKSENDMVNTLVTLAGMSHKEATAKVIAKRDNN